MEYTLDANQLMIDWGLETPIAVLTLDGIHTAGLTRQLYLGTNSL